MLRSEHRILTTHMGGLPRPAALTALYARRSVGEVVDEAAIDTLGKVATRHVVRKQIAAGIDVGNNGEQMSRMYRDHSNKPASWFITSLDILELATAKVPRLLVLERQAVMIQVMEGHLSRALAKERELAETKAPLRYCPGCTGTISALCRSQGWSRRPPRR